MEAVLQGQRRPFVFTRRRARPNVQAPTQPLAAQEAIQRFAEAQAYAVRRRNMTNPAFQGPTF